jgi:hypothetical protein
VFFLISCYTGYLGGEFFLVTYNCGFLKKCNGIGPELFLGDGLFKYFVSEFYLGVLVLYLGDTFLTLNERGL